MSFRTYLPILCIPLFFSYVVHVSAECVMSDEPGYDQYSRGKYSYECRTQDVCLGTKYQGEYWDFNTSKQLIATHDKTKYPDLSEIQKLPTLEDIRKTYQTVQDTIFSCATLKSKYSIHTELIANDRLSKKSHQYLKKLNQQIEQDLEKNGCLGSRQADKVYNYKDLLDSLSYEECVYHTYLWYYDQVAQKNIGLISGDSARAIDVSHNVSAYRQDISGEYELSAKAMDSALALYENFHKMYAPHILLEMIAIELQGNKTLVSKFLHAFKQFINLSVGAQKAP